MDFSFTGFSRAIQVLGSLNPTSRIEKVKISQALQSLKEILFLNSEVIRFIKDIEQGRDVELNEAQILRDEFRELSHRMHDTLSYLDPRRFDDVERIMPRDAHLLDQIKYGKIDIRRKVSDLFEDYIECKLHHGRNIDDVAATASSLLAQIGKLNKEIDGASRRLSRLKRN